ncbi:MAG: hypothetical protein ACREF7_00265, partial [Candidatus Saccharimonadales bacterium]
MSYSLKYTLTFREQTGTASTGALYKINIYESGFSGDSAAMIASGNPITLSYKKQDLISPIMGSELTLGLMSTTNEQYAEFLTAAPLQYYVDVLISTNNGTSYSTYWSGVNTTDCYTEPWQQPPYDINLKFNCGLGELQWHRYENPTYLISGVEQLIAIISNCLSFLPYIKNVREMINIREDTMNDLAGFLEQTYLMDIGFCQIADDGVLHGLQCNTLLNQILTALNCRIYQSNNMWFVERIWERTQSTFTYFDYTPTGAIQNPPYTYSNVGSGTLNTIKSIANSTMPKLLGGGELAATQKKPSLAYNFSGGAQGIDNVELLVNSFFEDKPTSKNAQGQPTNWDLGANLTANGLMQVEKVNPYVNDATKEDGMSFAGVIVPFNALVASKYMPLQYFTWTGAVTNYPLSWSAHAVRRTGDPYSNPSVYLDTLNGSLTVNMGFYFDWLITPMLQSTMSDLTNVGGDAYELAGGAGISIYIPVKITFTDKNSHSYTIDFNLVNPTLINWAKDSASLGMIETSLADIAYNFPDPSFT